MIKSKKSSSKSKKAKVEKGVNTIALEQEISRILGMNVTIDTLNKTSSNEGVVKVEYKSLDQLDDVIHRLSKQ